MHKVLAAMLVLLVGLSGCSMFTPVKYRTNFSITGFVKDGGSPGQPAIPGATVSLSSQANVGTNNEGAYVFGGVANGDYSLIAKKDGYTSESYDVKIDGSSILIPNLGITEYSATAHADVVLYPLTATLAFNLRIQPKASGTTEVSTLPVIKAVLLKATTDKNTNVTTFTEEPANTYDGTIDATTGAVSFTKTIVDGTKTTTYNLPRAPYVRIYVQSFKDANGNAYAEQNWGPFDLTAGSMVIPDRVLVPSVTTPVILAHNFDSNFPVAGTLSVTFNKTMDKDLTTLVLKNGITGKVIPITSAWDTTTKVLTITPQKTLASATTYYLSGTATSSDGYASQLQAYVPEVVADPSATPPVVGVPAVPETRLKLTTKSGIDFKSSNFLTKDYDGNRFATGTALTVQFTENVDHLGAITLYQGTSSAGIPVEATATFATDTLTVTPAATLKNDTSYVLHATVYGAGDGASDDIVFNDSSTIVLAFKTVASATAVTKPAAPTLTAGSFNTLDWNTTSVPISIPPVSGATGYTVYARVTGTTTDWVKVPATLTTPNAWDPSVTSTNVTLTANLIDANLGTGTANLFNKYAGSPTYTSTIAGTPAFVYTPFAGGQSLDFKVVATNSAGSSPDSTTIAVSDTKGPQISDKTYPAAWSAQTAITAGGSITFTLLATEYLSAVPTSVTLTGLTGATCSGSDIAWAGTNTPYQFTIRVNNPTGAAITPTNSSSVQFTLKDQSGKSTVVTLGYNTGVTTITYQ